MARRVWPPAGLVHRTLTLLPVLALALLPAAAPPAWAQSPAGGHESLQEVGEFHLRSGRWKDAAAVFAALAEDPNATPAVYRGLGEAYFHLGRRADAIAAFEMAQQRGGDSKARDLLIELHSDGREGWPRAIELLQQAVADRPDDIERQRRLADLLVYEGRIAEAIPVLANITAARPDDATALLLYARCLAWTGKFAEAAPAFERGIAAGGAIQADDRSLIAQAHEAIGDNKRANTSYREHLKSKPNDNLALAGLARTAVALGNVDEARRAIDGLRGAAQRDPDLELSVARLDASLGNYNRALPAFARALEKDATPTLAYEYADMLVAAGRSDEALAVILRYPDDSPRSAATRLRVLAAAPQHRSEASELAVELLRGSPTPDTVRIARDIMLSTPDAELSLDLAERVGQHYPRDRAVQSKRANTLLARGQKQRAEQVLTQMRAAAPKDTAVLASLVATQVHNRNFDAAKRSLADAGSAVERDPRLLSTRAGLRFSDGDLDGARADYESALRLDARQTEARIGLAEIALARGDVEEAERRLAAAPALPAARVADLRQRVATQQRIAAFRRQPSESVARELEPALRAELKRSPARADYRLLLAQALETTGQNREALAQYQLLQSEETATREAFLAPVRIHLALGESNEAERAFERFQERFPGEEDVAQARLLAGKGEQRKRAGDFAGAVESYRSAIALAPSNVEIWNGIAGVYFAAGDLNAAIDAFDNVLAIDASDEDARRGRIDAMTALTGKALESGDVAGTEALLTRTLEAAGNDRAALEQVAGLGIAARNWDLASAAVERMPDSAEARTLRDRIYVERELGTIGAAPEQVPAAQLLAVARRGLLLQPERTDLLLLEAQALERLGEIEPALVAFRNAAAKGSTSTDAYAGQVRLLVAAGRLSEARIASDNLRRIDSEAAVTVELPLLLAEADAAKRRGRLPDALASAQRALALDPGNADAHMTLGGIYAEAKQYDDAIAAYGAALQSRPSDPVVLRGLAGAHQNRGNLAEAATLYNQLLAQDPTDADARRGQAGLWVAEAGRNLRDQQIEAADQLLDRALAIAPDNRDAVAMKLQVLVGRGDWTEARARVAAVSESPWRRELESWLRVEEGLATWRANPASMPPAAALRLVEEGLRANPERGELRLARAQILEASGERERALAAYREVSGDAAAEGMSGQIRLLTALGRYADAERLLDDFAAARPEAANRERATIHRARAAAMRELGQREAAFAAARDALALEPGNADTLTLIGWIYLDSGQAADAAASFAAALAQRPRDRTALEGLASAYETAGDWQNAERAYLDLAQLPDGTYPAEARTRIDLRRTLAQVGALRDEGRLDAAADLLEDLRQRHPREPELWATLSEIRNELRQTSLALTYAEQGLRLAPNDERLHLARIRALNGLGRFEEADAAIVAARGHVRSETLAQLEHDAARERARAKREQWMRDGRLDLAYLGLAEEFQLAPNDPDVLRAIGYLYLETEQYPEARQFFERAVRVNPGNVDGQLGLAYALRGSGEPGAAAKRIESVFAARPSADAALILAELYHEQGRNGDAARMLAQARSLGGAPRHILPPLRVGQARTVAPELRAERGTVLPPLVLPEGTLRAVPDRVPLAPLYKDVPRTKPHAWRDGRVQSDAELPALAFAESDVVNDAAPLAAYAFAGAALPALRRHATDAENDTADAPLQIAQALPSFDRVMQDVGGSGSRRPTSAPIVDPRPRYDDAPIREEHFPAYPQDPYPRPATSAPRGHIVDDYVPAVPQEPAAPRQPFRSGYQPRIPVPYETLPAATDYQVAPALPPAYRQRLYLEREPAGAGLPIRESVEAPAPLTPQAQARLTALERKLQREQAMKLSAGFRYDFFNSVSDVISDEFAIWRFPVFLEVPALVGSRLRVTAEPTVVDNGIVTDAGVAGEVALLGLRLGTDVAQASLGVGSTPAGFAEQVEMTGFGRLTLQASRNISVTPFFERKPMIESLLSYRGNERFDLFFGKVMMNRFGAAVGFRTPQDITGVVEAAYSSLRGIRVEDNERLDAFFSIGRDFALGDGFVVRPGAQAFFMHYDKDLSEAYPLGLDPLEFPFDEFPPGAGYFSPDSFLEAALRLDLLGPLLPEMLPGSIFRVGGRVGGQWVSGLETARFASSEGSRATFGGDAGVEIPMGEVVIFSAGTGFVVADPYDRVYFEMALLFPL